MGGCGAWPPQRHDGFCHFDDRYHGPDYRAARYSRAWFDGGWVVRVVWCFADDPAICAAFCIGALSRTAARSFPQGFACHGISAGRFVGASFIGAAADRNFAKSRHAPRPAGSFGDSLCQRLGDDRFYMGACDRPDLAFGTALAMDCHAAVLGAPLAPIDCDDFDAGCCRPDFRCCHANNCCGLAVDLGGAWCHCFADCFVIGAWIAKSCLRARTGCC